MELDWTTIRRNVLPALAAAVVAGGLWFGIPVFFGSEPEPEPPPESVEPVAEVQVEVQAPSEPAQTRPTILVARVPIGAGTLLTDEHVEWSEWSGDLSGSVGVMVQGVVPLHTVVGAIATRSLERGVPIDWSGLLVSDHPGYISAVLDPGMVAVTIDADVSTNVIYPGDRVNVMLVGPQAGGGFASTTIVHDTRVLAVGTVMYSLASYRRINLTEGIRVDPPPLPAGSNYTLELTKRDAERIAVADKVGTLKLAVRPSFADGGPDWSGDPTPTEQVMPPVDASKARSIRVIRGVEAGPVPEQGL